MVRRQMDRNLKKFYLAYKKKNWKNSDLSAEYKKAILDHFLKKIKREDFKYGEIDQLLEVSEKIDLILKRIMEKEIKIQAEWNEVELNREIINNLEPARIRKLKLEIEKDVIASLPVRTFESIIRDNQKPLTEEEELELLKDRIDLIIEKIK